MQPRPYAVGMTVSKRRTPLITLAAVLIGAFVILWAMGRPPICTCGEIDLWVNASDSPKTSQMLADWYSPSHIIHGFIFYGLLWLFARRRSLELRFGVALLVEAAWEIIENSNWAIERYREATIAVGYTGDSILNTMSDILMAAAGFWLARRLPIWASVAVIVALELMALAVIRDNLTLNIWMFLFPTDAVRAWQAGA
jgi:hypothetical protein